MKKNYNQPIVELTHMMPSSMVMAGSPLQNSGQGTNTIPDTGDPIVGG